MESDERIQASSSQYAASIRSPVGSPGDTNRHDPGQRPLRRRSEATTPTSFDPSIYSHYALEPPEHFDVDGVIDHRDPGSRLDLGAQNGAIGQEAWQKRRRKRGGYKLLGGMMMAQEASGPARWRIALADRQVIQRSAVNVLLIGLWYLFSLSISIYNKWMFSPDHLDFHFPLFTTSLHMLVQFSFASAVLFFFPHFRPRHDSLTNPKNERRREAVAGNGKPLMTVYFYLTRITPCGTATGLDIGLGNMSLKFISLTFLTMCKSSALAFVLIFAFLFRLETPSVKLVLIIAAMTGGVVMMVAGEAAFDLLGFVLVILSAFFSGFRWALTQILLLRNPATSNPFSTIFFLAPVMFASLIILAFPIETPGALVGGLRRLGDTEGSGRAAGLLLFPGVLAFCMTSAEFALLRRTSVVTLSICGIFKEVVTISASQFTYHDPLTPINLSGLAVTIASIGAYNYIKISRMRKDARAEVIGGDGELGREGDDASRNDGEEGEGLLSQGEHDGDLRKDLDVMTSGMKDDMGEGRARLSPTSRSHASEQRTFPP